jgi:methionine-rich copper-binding protein CopC
VNSSTFQRRPKRAALLPAASLAALLSVAGFASPAYAHDAPVGSVPENGVTLSELPESFSVTMSNPITVRPGTEKNFGIQITDAAGLYYGDGCVTFDDATMSTPAELGEAGTYSMVWQLVSSDDHPTDNKDSNPVSFEWQPAAGTELAVGSATPPVCAEPAPTPEPSMTANAAAPDEGDADEDAGSQEPGDITDTSDATPVLWIGGGVLVVLLGVGAALLISRRNKQ